jgi:osmotically-inducible protein OsmY
MQNRHLTGLSGNSAARAMSKWDLRDAIRLSREVPGVKRVVDELEIKLGGE